MGVGTQAQSVRRVLLSDAPLIVLGVVLYFAVRGRTEGAPEVARDHAQDVLALERHLRLDVEAGVQALLVGSDLVVDLANWVYIWGHWPVIGLTFLWLALHDRRLFRRLRTAMCASGALGLCVYTTYPVAPPRLAGQGFVDTITERSRSYRVLQPPTFVNQYAAMPSLHVGWDLCVGLVVVAACSSYALRTLAALMPVVMAAATVVTANHYVLDVVAGAALGLVGWAVALRVERRREARADTPTSPPAPPRQRLPVAPEALPAAGPGSSGAAR